MVEALEGRRLLTTYYVSTSGSDSNSGTSASAPWASVAKVDATTFNPGDTILFQAGGVWHGQLIAGASGTAGNPITYGEYGSGAKPIFDGSDVVPEGSFTLVSGTTYTFNVSSVANAGGNAYWVYENSAGLEAAGDDSTSGTDTGSVFNNAGSFYINGSTVYVNTGSVNPNTSTTTNFSLGDRGAGTNANSSLIDSNGYNYITFENIEGRDTAEVGSGNSLTGGINDGYVFRIQGGSNVTLLNVDGEYGSKHIMGAIDTTAFLAQGCTFEGAPEGTPGNGLPYGNATATVAYADNSQSGIGDTSSWINDTVSNYDGGQPAFLTHEDAAGDMTSILLQNFVSLGSPIALEPDGGVAITITGGEITNNTLTAYGATGTTELINGMTFTGSGSAAEVYGGATVENCLFEGSSQSNQAIQVSGAGNLIRFNTIVPPSYSAAIALESGETGANIYGNLISGTTDDISVAGNDTYTADYNFFDSTAGTPNAASGEPHSVTANPDFAGSTATYAYALTSGSPAINLIPSSNTTLQGLSTETSDILGESRPNGGGYDAGAYEYQLATYPPTVATAASASPNPVTGTTSNLSVLGADQAGENNLTYTWATTGTPPAAVTFSANGTNAAKNDTATFTAAGTYMLQATIADGSYTTTSSVTVVVNQTPTSLSVTPQSPYVAVNTTQQFTAAVTDQFGNAISNPSVTWAVTNGSGSISNAGLYTAPSTATGSTMITATSGAFSATDTFTVTPPNQAPTVATAASASSNPVTSTNTTTLSVLGADQDGESSLTYTWSLAGTPPASVTYSANGTNAAKNTTATFTKNGTYNFLVTITGPGNLSTTSSVTVTVNSINPITVDGNLDASYGSPLATQTVTTNVGSNSSGGGVEGTSGITSYTQLSAAYGVINESTGYFYLFLAGSLSLNNQHLNILIDSVPGEGPSNLNALASVGPYNNGSGFSNLILDSGFNPDYIFTTAFGTGTSINSYNFDTGASGSDNVSDPSTTEINTGGSSVPLFYEKVNNAAVSSAVAPANAGSLTTGAEFAFSLSALGYTTADYNAGDKIGVMALVTFGSFTQFSNQCLAPLNETAAGMSANGGYYFQGSSSPTNFSNASQFPGNQFFSVAPPGSGSQGPTVATAASASPSPVTGDVTQLSVLGADAAGASTLTYNWSTTGNPPAAVSFSANGTNAAQNTTATFTASGTYNFLVIITDPSNLSTTSTVTVTVTLDPAWLSSSSVATWNEITHVLTVTGPASIIADPGSDEPLVQASGSSAVLTLDPTSGTDIHLGGLSLTSGATANVTSLGAARTTSNYHLLVIGTPNATAAPMYTIDSTSTLNLADNDMAILYGSGTSPLSTVSAELAQAYDGGPWDKPGLTSSVAATSSGETALGYAEASALGVTTFDGLTLGGNAVLVKYTLVGDTMLRGTVGLGDYDTVLSNYGNAEGWIGGDFHYGGVVGIGDYDTMLSNYGKSLASVLGSGSSPAIATTTAKSTATTTSSAAPTAALAASPLKTAAAYYTFTVTYSSSSVIETSTLNVHDLYVTGPGNYSASASLVSFTSAKSGKQVTVTYRIKSAGSKWTSAHNGKYQVKMRADVVKNQAGAFVAGGVLGALQVVI